MQLPPQAADADGQMTCCSSTRRQQMPPTELDACRIKFSPKLAAFG